MAVTNQQCICIQLLLARSQVVALLLLCLHPLGNIGVFVERPCAKRVVENDPDRIVCVCNATYCDAIGDVVLPPRGSVLSYTSDISGRRMEKQVTQLQMTSTNTERLFWKDDYNSVNVTLHLKNKTTNIMGFGGSITDSVGINLLDMPEELADHLIKSYFGPTGIGYTMTRIPIGGCDFSTYNYTYDDNNGRVDTLLLNFTLQEEDYKYKIPFIKKALALEPRLQVMASPWSAPPWMKNNKAHKRGFLQLKYYHSWANYFAKFIQSYEGQGIPIWGVSVQNEPALGFLPWFFYISMQYTPWGEATFVEFLGPVLKASGYGDVKIMIFDCGTGIVGPFHFIMPWVTGVLSNKVASSYISGISIHWYTNKYVGYGPIKKVLDKFPDKFMISTEASVGFLPWEPKLLLGSWERGEDYMSDIVENLRIGVRGWIDWNIILDYEGGPNYAGYAGTTDCVILTSKDKTEFYKQPSFYGMAHISSFIPPSSQVVVTTMDKFKTRTARNEDTDEFKFSAKFRSVGVIRPDGSVVVAILNREDKNITVNLVDGDLMTTDKPFKLKLSPRSMTTLLYTP